MAFLKTSKVMCITISIAAEQLSYGYAILERKKGEIHVLDYKNHLNDLESLKLNSTNKYPILISVQGKGVLSKTVTVLDEDTDAAILSKVLPNAEIEDFYLSKVHVDEAKSLVSIIRKEACDAVLETFPQDKIIGLSIGANQMTKLASYIDSDKTWYFGVQTWKQEGAQIIISKLKEDEVVPEWQKIEGESIPTECLEAYAHGLAFLVEDTEAQVAIPQFGNNSKDHLFSKLFVMSGWTVLIVLFSVLMINFLLFDHYGKKKAELDEQLSHNSLALEQMKILEKEITFKEDFIKYNSTDQTRFSYYSDRLAVLLPKNIVLVDLYIQPLEKRLKQGKETQLEKETIIVRGFTKNSTTLNQWVKDIQKEEWVRDTEVIEYNREAANLSGEFELEIMINKEL